MKALRNCMVALFLGSAAPVLIWVGLFRALRHSHMETGALAERAHTA